MKSPLVPALNYFFCPFMAGCQFCFYHFLKFNLLEHIFIESCNDPLFPIFHGQNTIQVGGDVTEGSAGCGDLLRHRGRDLI